MYICVCFLLCQHVVLFFFHQPRCARSCVRNLSATLASKSDRKPHGVRPRPSTCERGAADDCPATDSQLWPESAMTRSISSIRSRLRSAFFEAHHTSLAFTNLRPKLPAGSLRACESIASQRLNCLHFLVALLVSASATSIASRSPSTAASMLAMCCSRFPCGSAYAILCGRCGAAGVHALA